HFDRGTRLAEGVLEALPGLARHDARDFFAALLEDDGRLSEDLAAPHGGGRGPSVEGLPRGEDGLIRVLPASPRQAALHASGRRVALLDRLAAPGGALRPPDPVTA